MFDRFSMEDRAVMVFATQEAAELGHRGLGNDHLILGMLGNARSPLFELLGDQGLTLKSARETVRAYHADHAEEAPDDADEVTAADRYAADREALASIGIDLDKVRAAVGDRFGDDLAGTWGQRPLRGRGRRRHRGGPCGEERGHRHGHGRGRGGPGGSGPGGCGPDSDEGGPENPGRSGEREGGPWEGGRGRRGPRGRGGRPRMASSTREAMRSAVDRARDRGDRALRPEYLLLGILDAGDAASIALIESATTVDALREAVLASLPEAPASV